VQKKNIGINTDCENAKDSSFVSTETTSFIIMSFESGVSSSHKIPSCAPAASSIMIYSEPTGLSALALHPYTRGTGTWSTVRAYQRNESFFALISKRHLYGSTYQFHHGYLGGSRIKSRPSIRIRNAYYDRLSIIHEKTKNLIISSFR
jgi:hypothetical protein